MEIIKGKTNDVEKILDIFDACKKKMKELCINQWSDRYPDRGKVIDDIRNNSLFILQDKKHYIGVITISGQGVKEFSEIKWAGGDDKAVYVYRLAVHPDYQRRGFAGEMMKFAEDYASKSGFSSIRLAAYSGNKAVLDLYEKLKYKRAGKIFFPEHDIPFYCFEKGVIRQPVAE